MAMMKNKGVGAIIAAIAAIVLLPIIVIVTMIVPSVEEDNPCPPGRGLSLAPEGGVIGSYGLPAGTSIFYGQPGFPPWVMELAKRHNVRASTYPGHQEGDRNEPGYAPNPGRLNRGIDWNGSVEDMHKFAEYLRSIAPGTPALEQIIWQNPSTGEKIGWSGRSPDTSGSYYAADYGGHQDHVHTRQSASFGGAVPETPPTDRPPTERPPAVPTDPSVVTVGDWEKVAHYESTDNWAINNGNGFYGGLQFTAQTWAGFRGTEYAPTADKATKEQQMEVANRVLKEQGWDAWPQTSHTAGVRGKKPAPAGAFVGVAGVAPSAVPDATRVAVTRPGKPTMPLKEGSFTYTSMYKSADRPGHRGVDMGAPDGTPMYAAADGVVAEAGPAGGFGQWIVLDHQIDGKKVSTVYGHMWDGQVLVKTGDQVAAGQHIAAVGSNGESSGPHLHFEVWIGGRLSGGQETDPKVWLEGANAPTGADVQTAGARAPPNCGFGVSPGGKLKAGSVRPEFEPWVIKAGAMCPEVSAPLIAAQIEQESGWNPNAVSPAGAQGLSQFMPYTWPTYAVDANNNGRADPFDPPDAIMAQGKFDCDTAAQAKKDIAAGRISGDLTDIILNAYNCGYGCVLANGGPRIVNGETEGYASGIKPRMAKYTDHSGDGDADPDHGSDFGTRVVRAAEAEIGKPYVWGGGDQNGPTAGTGEGGIGYDCSGLTLFAIAKASDDTIVLPHLTDAQVSDNRGKKVSKDDLRPGDLIFFGSADHPHHVAIYHSDGKILHASQRGTPVLVQPLAQFNSEEQHVRRFG